MRGLIYSPENVRALLEGRKTQTRRLVRIPKWMRPLDPRLDEAFNGWLGLAEEYLKVPCYRENVRDDIWRDGHSVQRLFSPYRPGDLVYVKETWWEQAGDLYYKADYPEKPVNMVCDGGKWKSSRIMPEWASRIIQEILKVRVERLQEISEEDAFAEGIQVVFSPNDEALERITGPFPHRDYQKTSKRRLPVAYFAALWDSLHKEGERWADSPWEFVYEFKFHLLGSGAADPVGTAPTKREGWLLQYPALSDPSRPDTVASQADHHGQRARSASVPQRASEGET